MKRWGIYCLILGVGSFILPLMGYQFRILSLFGGATPIIAVMLMIAGIVMLVTGSRQEA